MSEKRNAKKILLLLVLTLMLTFMFSMSTMAAAKTVSLNNNKWYTDKNTNYNQNTVYHKIKIPRNGLITISGYGYSNYSTYKYSIGVQLCNSKKKPLQKFNSYLSQTYKYKTYYAVKKGTYYIKTQSSKYKLKYSFKSMSDNSGNRQSKARNVNKNKVAKGLLIAGENGNKVDWYKIVLTKPQKIKLTFGALASDWIQFKITSADPNITIFGSTTSRKYDTQTQITQSAFPAGTYYIQVSRLSNSTDCSGYYTLKWK